MAGAAQSQAALAEGATSVSGSGIPFARDLLWFWLSLPIQLPPLLKYKLAYGSSCLCPSLRDQLCCCGGRLGRRISFSLDSCSVSFASSPNQAETMSVHISHVLEAVSRDTQCGKCLLIKEKITEWLQVVPVLELGTDL